MSWASTNYQTLCENVSLLTQLYEELKRDHEELREISVSQKRKIDQLDLDHKKEIKKLQDELIECKNATQWHQYQAQKQNYTPQPPKLTKSAAPSDQDWIYQQDTSASKSTVTGRSHVTKRSSRVQSQPTTSSLLRPNSDTGTKLTTGNERAVPTNETSTNKIDACKRAKVNRKPFIVDSSVKLEDDELSQIDGLARENTDNFADQSPIMMTTFSKVNNRLTHTVNPPEVDIGKLSKMEAKRNVNPLAKLNDTPFHKVPIRP